MKADIEFDMNQSVTLTGIELQHYVQAQIAAARAQDAADLASPVMIRIRESLSKRRDGQEEHLVADKRGSPHAEINS